MKKGHKRGIELMPKGKEALALLQSRANQLANLELEAKGKNGVSFIRFGLNQNEYYGVSYHYVQDILHHVPVAKPPFVPHFIAGVINWRGSLITVVDLCQFFHAKSSDEKDCYIIVISACNTTLGLLVNRIEGSESYQPEQLSPPLSLHNIAKEEYILGLHQAVTAIINVEILMPGIKDEVIKKIMQH